MVCWQSRMLVVWCWEKKVESSNMRDLLSGRVFLALSMLEKVMQSCCNGMHAYSVLMGRRAIQLEYPIGILELRRVVQTHLLLGNIPLQQLVIPCCTGVMLTLLDGLQTGEFLRKCWNHHACTPGMHGH